MSRSLRSGTTLNWETCAPGGGSWWNDEQQSKVQLQQGGGRAMEDAIAPAESDALVAVAPALGRSRLPRWFDVNRVQGHTRLRLRDSYDKPEFTHAAAGFKAVGAGAFTRHVKSADEDPPWPTALPLWDDGLPYSDRERFIDGVRIVRARNVAQEIIDEAHSEGLKIVVYYWHMAEARLATLHPDWVCMTPDGDAIEGPRRRGTHLDITGPYRELVLTRLLELADMGADGFYFDYRHLPPEGCWGSALEEAWVAETGQPRAPTETDEDYLRFIDFKASKIEETFVYWRDEVKAEHPEVVFLISTTTVPALTLREMTTRLARVADSAKNEYRHAVNRNFNKGVFEGDRLAVPSEHVRQALGWTVLRDATDGRPPHIWVSGVPDIYHARAAAASLVTFGCVANMDVWEDSLIGGEDQPDGKTPLDGIRAAFALGDAVSAHLARTRPLRWAAVHFGERSRNARGADYRGAWQQVLWPLVGAYQVLSEDGLPVGVVNDYQLEHGQLDDYRLLFLPKPGELTAAQLRAVAVFTAREGVVIDNDPTWAWSDPSGTDAAAAAFRAAVEPHSGTAPVRVIGGPTSRYAVSYHRPGQLVVAVTNDFGWVQITQANEMPSEINPPAPPVEGVEVTWRTGHGLPPTPVSHPRPHRLRAIETVSGRTLKVQEINGRFRVELPTFPFMALLVVTEK
jgi:hypothetical protein